MVKRRVERRHRVLEDHRRSACRAARCSSRWRLREQILAVEQDLAGLDRGRRRQQAHDRQAGHASCPSRTRRPARACRRPECEKLTSSTTVARRPSAQADADRQVLHLEGGGRRASSALPRLRIVAVAQPVAERVEGQHRDQDARGPGTARSTSRSRSARGRRRSSRPRTAAGGGMPAPRKLSDASRRITWPTSSVAATSSVGSDVGKDVAGA